MLFLFSLFFYLCSFSVLSGHVGLECSGDALTLIPCCYLMDPEHFYFLPLCLVPHLPLLLIVRLSFFLIGRASIGNLGDFYKSPGFQVLRRNTAKVKSVV